MNNCSFIGRLTSTPELKTTQNGTAVSSFQIAVDRKFKDINGEKQTDFIPITAWRSTAEFAAKYFMKGQRIGVTGSLQMREYTDKDGNNRKVFEIIADGLDFADGKRDNIQPSGATQYDDYSNYNGYQQNTSYRQYPTTPTAYTSQGEVPASRENTSANSTTIEDYPF